jgi:putative ABC transport system substrate-binding protein
LQTNRLQLLKRCLAAALLSVANAIAPAHGQPRPFRIGMLVAGPPPGEHACVAAFRQGFSELGYVEGVTHSLSYRWAKGRPEESFPVEAGELVKQGAELVVVVSSQGLQEAKPVLSAVPVVMAVSSYPVERNLIASLARPGANITGIATFTGDLYRKRIQLLADTLPGVSRVAVLRPSGDMSDLIQRDLEAGARLLGLKLFVIDVNHKEELASAFRVAAESRAQAVMTTQSPFFYENREALAELALKHRLPSFTGEPLGGEAGMLITHGASVPDSCRRAARFADRILKGHKPADIPVEQPTHFELVVNMKTARALGVTIPRVILIRADRVIE